MEARALVKGSVHEVVDPTRVITLLGPVADFSEFVGLKARPAAGKQSATPPRPGTTLVVNIATPGASGAGAAMAGAAMGGEGEGGDPFFLEGESGWPIFSKRRKGCADEDEYEADCQWLTMESAFVTQVAPWPSKKKGYVELIVFIFAVFFCAN